MFLLGLYLSRLIKTGRLTIIDPRGKSHVFGGAGGPVSTIKFNDHRVAYEILLGPSLRFGEAYMAGRVDLIEGSISDFIDLMARNMAGAAPPPLARLAVSLNLLFRRLHQFNTARRAQQNAAHHYNISRELYEMFLDTDRQYSCAYFEAPDETLEAAQYAKKRHLAAKLFLKPGQRVLDIGCGWGGLGLYLAAEAEAQVTGITLASEQLAVARERALAARLDDRVDFELRDYRDQQGLFDRIVSVGMFEHVGVNHYTAFFNKLRSLLADDGVAMLHTIGRTDGPGFTDPWIRKYIFPGGYIPALSEVVRAVEKTGLIVTDIEVLRLHYAETCAHWQARFQANRDKAKALYDERFCRMWEYYLAASEASFRHLGTVVFQIQMAKEQTALPLTRDYIADWKRAHPHRDRASPQQDNQRAA